MEIIDNGKGFRYNESNFQSNGMGINNMQKRIQLLNGTMRIMTAEKKGTRILFNIICN
jgi:signal transduction histidine kinase